MSTPAWLWDWPGWGNREWRNGRYMVQKRNWVGCVLWWSGTHSQKLSTSITQSWKRRQVEAGLLCTADGGCGLASLRAEGSYRGAVSWCRYLGGNCSWYFPHTLSTSVLGPGKAFSFLWAWEHQHPWHCHACANNTFTLHKGWGLETMCRIYDGILSSLIFCREPQLCVVHMSVTHECDRYATNRKQLLPCLSPFSGLHTFCLCLWDSSQTLVTVRGDTWEEMSCLGLSTQSFIHSIFTNYDSLPWLLPLRKQQNKNLEKLL